MRFSLDSPWPNGAYLIPTGTIITVEDGVARWTNGVLPLPMPMTARALDQEAADHLSIAYPFNLPDLRCAGGVRIRKLINVGD